MDNFESSSGLNDGYGTSDDIICGGHLSIDAQQLGWNNGSDKHIARGEQAFCLPDELFNEFSDVGNESLE